MSTTTPVDTELPREAARAAAWEKSALEGTFATRWIQLEAAVVTSCGSYHAVNEDCHSTFDSRSSLFVVADGVGGGAHAATASRQLVSHLHEALDGGDSDADSVRMALIDADRAIDRSISIRTQARGAATVALCKGSGARLSSWIVAWVGDCRVYRMDEMSGASADLVTVDDSYRELDEVPPRGGSPDDPARMVGNGAVGVPNVREITLVNGEMVVLCSDGVHKHTTASDIGFLLSGPAPLARRCERLVDFARECGSRDDATVLVVRRVPRAAGRLARVLMAAALVAGTALWLASDSGVRGHAGPAPIELRQGQGAT